MKRLLLSLAGVLLVSPPVTAPATILLNEIHLRTPASSDTVPNDRNFEFVELKSTTGGVEPCTDLWILVIENDGGGVGEVKQAWPLKNPDGTAMATGANGLLLLGDSYTKPDSPYQFIKSAQTTMGDPSGMGPDNLEDTSALTFLLVSGYTNPAPLPGTTKPDFDMDDDGTGVFDWNDPTPPPSRYTAAPWTAIVDSVGFNGDQGTVIKVSYAPANISRVPAVTPPTLYKGVAQAGSTTTNFMPHTIARGAANVTANSRVGWYGGTIFGSTSDADSVIYNTSYFNTITGATWKGLVTPGQPNLATAPVAPVFRLNEINLNPTGTPGRTPNPLNPALADANDGKFEYVEIVNTVATQAGGTNFSGSLANYSLIVVDSGGVAGLGKIREAWNLNKFATGQNGLLVLGDDYPGGYSPFAGMFDATTQFADPDETLDTSIQPNRLKFSKMSMGDLANNGVTFFLVQGFSGHIDDDIDDNDDGVLNATLPWTGLVDSVSVPEVDKFNALVPTHGGYSPAKPDIVVATKHYNADNLSRIKGVNTANVTVAWSAGVFGSASPYGLSYRNGFSLTGSGTAFRGAASPGRANYSSSALPTAGSFRLNEVNIDPPVSPDNTEYVEVISDTPFALMTNLWLIVLDATPSDSGRVKKVIDLRGQSTGANRLAVFGDGIEEDTAALVEYMSARTLRDDPVSFNADGTENSAGEYNFTPDSLAPDTGISVLLVSYTPPTATGVPVAPNADLDGNNDGNLDAAAPWTLIDGISTGNGVGGASVAPASGFTPANVCRYTGNFTANSPAAWFGGQLTGGTATSFDYSNNFFGTFKGAASPGRQNVTATPSAAASLLLNEININPPGGDNNKELVELRSSTGAAISTIGYSVLLVDNDGGDTGRVLKVWDLDSAATGTNGLLLTGPGYSSTVPGSVPWIDAAAPEAATKIFAPDTMEPDDIGLNTDNGALTVLLVKNFTGRMGDDLDAGTQDNMLAADDHVFNTPVPWAQMADSAAMKGFLATTTGGITTYTLEGFIFPGTADLTVPQANANGYTPDTVARFSGNTTANNASSWYGANLFGTAGTSTIYDSVQYFPASLNGGKLTPGQTNVEALADDSDTDSDGIPYLMEVALGLNPFVSDTTGLPQVSLVTLDNIKQPAFTYSRPTGGVSGITYTVQGSFDLNSWTLPVIMNRNQPDVPSTGRETQTWVVEPNFLPLLPIRKHVFIRLKVQRQ